MELAADNDTGVSNSAQVQMEVEDNRIDGNRESVNAKKRPSDERISDQEKFIDPRRPFANPNRNLKFIPVQATRAGGTISAKANLKEMEEHHVT